VAIRNSDLDDYAEIGDLTFGLNLNGQKKDGHEKPSYLKQKSFSISDPTCVDGEAEKNYAGEGTEELSMLYAQIDMTKKTKYRAGASGQYVNCDVFSDSTTPPLPARQYSSGEILPSNGSIERIDKETPGLNYISVQFESKSQK
jgi:hypothetical protein